MRKMAQIGKGLLYKHKDLILVPQHPDKKIVHGAMPL